MAASDPTPSPTPSARWIRLGAWFALQLGTTRRAQDGSTEIVERLWRGRLLSRVRFESGRAQGPSESWWPNGVKRSHGSHRGGARDGDWFEFLPDGTLDRARTGLYRDGLRIAGIRGFNEWLGSP